MKPTGDCYQVAGRMVMDSSDMMLCHGTAAGQGPLKGKRIGHAWCEHGDVVFDSSNGNQVVVRKERYYKIGKIKNIKRYSHEEACRLMLKTKNFGPWRI